MILLSLIQTETNIFNKYLFSTKLWNSTVIEELLQNKQLLWTLLKMETIFSVFLSLYSYRLEMTEENLDILKSLKWILVLTFKVRLNDKCTQSSLALTTPSPFLSCMCISLLLLSLMMEGGASFKIRCLALNQSQCFPKDFHSPFPLFM
jgi:hypothetical protein